MSYTHLTKTELVFIEKYHEIGLSGRKIAEKLNRGHEAVYRVVRQLKNGLTAIDIYLLYKKNKSKCGRKKIKLTSSEKDYINEKVHLGWTPDVIVGRHHKSAVITLVERLTKCIIAIKPDGRQATNIESSLNQ